MSKYTITIPISTSIDPSQLLDFALEFGAKLKEEFGEGVQQDEDETCVEEVTEEIELSDTKCLLFQLSNEWESFVAVVDLTGARRDVLLKRMELADSLQEQALAWLQYFDHVDLYENSEAVEKWITDHADVEAFEEKHVAFCTEEPECVGWARARVDCSYVTIDGRHCFWEVRPKHADYTLETTSIRRDELGKEKVSQ